MRRPREEANVASRYDAIVIGTGQSGPSLAVDLATAGRQVAVLERHRPTVSELIPTMLASLKPMS